MAKRIPDDGFICSDCARALGGTWPDGHLATMHVGVCQCCVAWCGAWKAMANVGDWDWPDRKPRGTRD